MLRSTRVSSMLLVVAALCAIRGAHGQGRTFEFEWSPEGVRPYSDTRTPLRTRLDDKVIMRCTENVSNLYIQNELIQFETCNASAGLGIFNYNGFCLPGRELILSLTVNSADLRNTINFRNNSVYFLTSYSNGLLRDVLDPNFNSGGQCDLGLKVVLVIGEPPPGSLPLPFPLPPAPSVPPSDADQNPAVRDQNDPEDDRLNTLLIVAPTAAGLVLVVVISVMITVLLIKIGYCKKDDPLSHHVARNMNHSSQDIKGPYKLVKATDSLKGTPSPNHDYNHSLSLVLEQNLLTFGVQPVQRNFYVESFQFPAVRASPQLSEAYPDREDTQNNYLTDAPCALTLEQPETENNGYKDYVNSPSVLTSELDDNRDYVNSSNIDTAELGTEQESAQRNQHQVTSPSPAVSKPPVPPRRNRAHQARRKQCIDSPSSYSISSLSSQQSCEVTVQRNVYPDSYNLPESTKPLPPVSTKPLPPKRSERVRQLKLNFHIDSPPSPSTSRRTSRDEQHPASPSYPFYSVDSSSSLSVSKLAAHCSDNVQQMIMKRDFGRDSENLPVSKPSSPPSVYRKPYKKTGQQVDCNPHPSSAARTGGHDSEPLSPSPTVLSSQVLSRAFEIINKHDSNSAPITFKPGVQAWRII